jgi:hypothetical protein
MQQTLTFLPKLSTANGGILNITKGRKYMIERVREREWEKRMMKQKINSSYELLDDKSQHQETNTKIVLCPT